MINLQVFRPQSPLCCFLRETFWKQSHLAGIEVSTFLPALVIRRFCIHDNIPVLDEIYLVKFLRLVIMQHYLILEVKIDEYKTKMKYI